MVAIDELRTELEAKFEIDDIIKDITARLDVNMRTMVQLQGGFGQNVIFEGGFDQTGQFMVKLGLIRTQRSSLDSGSYSYTEKGRDLYSRLKEEKYYQPKTE